MLSQFLFMAEFEKEEAAPPASLDAQNRKGSGVSADSAAGALQFADVMTDSGEKLPPSPKSGEFDSEHIPGLTCPEASDMPPTRFDDALAEFREADAKQHIGHVPTVFWGSSTFANWSDLTSKFADLGAINRAMGGSTIPDLFYAARDAVLRHTPDRVVLYGMTNDLASGHLPEKVFKDFVTLEHLIHHKGPEPEVPGANVNIKLYVLGALPAPCRNVLDQKFHLYAKTNQLIKDYASHTPNVFFIDASEAIADKPGHIDESQFGQDHLHPKPSVYEKLNRIIHRNIMEHELPQP